MLNLFRRVKELETQMGTANQQLSAQQTQMNADTTRLNNVVTTMGTILADVQMLKTADQTTIAGLQEQLTALQTANPAIDFTQFEAGLGALEMNAGTVLTAVAPMVPPSATSTITPATPAVKGA